MRTNIVIDDKLMQDALRATGAKTKREVVELGLKTLVDLQKQEQARQLRGKITWEGPRQAVCASEMSAAHASSSTATASSRLTDGKSSRKTASESPASK